MEERGRGRTLALLCGHALLRTLISTRWRTFALRSLFHPIWPFHKCAAKTRSHSASTLHPPFSSRGHPLSLMCFWFIRFIDLMVMEFLSSNQSRMKPMDLYIRVAVVLIYWHGPAVNGGKSSVYVVFSWEHAILFNRCEHWDGIGGIEKHVDGIGAINSFSMADFKKLSAEGGSNSGTWWLVLFIKTPKVCNAHQSWEVLKDDLFMDEFFAFGWIINFNYKFPVSIS